MSLVKLKLDSSATDGRRALSHRFFQRYSPNYSAKALLRLGRHCDVYVLCAKLVKLLCVFRLCKHSHINK